MRAGLARLEFLAIVALAFATPPATAEPSAQISSAYTDFDAEKCKHEPGMAEEDYGTWECPGYAGIPILLSAGDQRMYVSFGDASDDNLAMSQTFPGFNDKGTVEWRATDGKPFATILRWNVMTGKDQEKATGPVSPSGSVLVVTRLGPGGTCQIGYVDARANPDANDLARKIADEHAKDFQCGKDKPIVLGKTDPDLALPSGE
jgi:hypothetical protein